MGDNRLERNDMNNVGRTPVYRLVMVISAGVFLSVSGSAIFAGNEPAGFQKGEKKGWENGQPPGFAHGQKKGWENDYPPGWDKKSDKEKAEWKDAVEKGKGNVTEAAKKKGQKADEADAAAVELEKAARKGLAVEDAEKLVIDEIEKGKKGDELAKVVEEETTKRLKEKDQDKKDKDKGKDKNGDDKEKGGKKGKGKKN